jgi:hypothetical protein
MLGVAEAFVRLRWRLLRGSIRHGGAEQFGAVVSTVASGLVGIGAGTAVLVAARTADHVDDLVVILCSLLMLAVLGFGIVAGISQPIDPRVIAAEPLSDRDRTIGLLASSAFGPPGLAGIALGFGLAFGMARGPSSLPIVVLAVVSWLLALLLIARTATNLLALLANRFPRAGQLVVGLTGLVFYGLFQFLPAVLGRLDDGQRATMADWLKWTPPGQVGRALSKASDPVGESFVHLVASAIWLPALAVGFAISSRQLALAVRRVGSSEPPGAKNIAIQRFIRRRCGKDASGMIAWRSILTRFRTPRTALETVLGAGVGLAAVLVPTLIRDSPGSGAVLVGGAVQLAVLFMAGNSFGIDGPAVTHEILAGAGPRALVAGKVRSIVIVAAPLAVVGPLVAAAVTNEWQYIMAGFGVGIGGLLAGTGAAIVQSAWVPIAIPESDNPFTGGESGKGLIAAMLLGVVLAGLAIATVPVALALFWATDRGNVGLVTLFGALTVVAGWAVMKLGSRIATGRLDARDPEFGASVTPAR